MQSRPVLVLLALCLVSGFSAASVWAQTDNTAMREAGKRRVEAQLEYNKAQQTLSAIAARIRSQHQARPEWVAAINDQRVAQRNHDVAVAPVREKVRASEEYKKLMAEKEKADTELEKLRDRRTSQDALMALATKSVELSSQMSKMEFDALNTDEKVTAAKAGLATANAKVAELRQIEEEAMRGDVEWQEAKKVVDEAQVKLAEANKAIADAQKAAAEAARANAASRRGSSRSSSRSRSY